MNATNHVKSEHGNPEGEEKSNELRDYLMLDDYDCIGFDLDHTLCRYNIGPMIRWDSNLEDQTKFHITQISVLCTCLRFEYDLLAKFLIEKRGYDEAIKVQSFDKEVDFVCKVIQITDARFFGDMHGEQTQGLTLDIAGGNLLRLGKDGVILAASHGTRLSPIFGFPSFQ